MSLSMSVTELVEWLDQEKLGEVGLNGNLFRAWSDGVFGKEFNRYLYAVQTYDV